jgi:branched-chain amino acid transport system permease protein
VSERPLDGAVDRLAPAVAAGGLGAAARRQWPWLAALLLAVAAPWFFFDWAHHRHSGFIVAMLTQMGIMSIFALSYNMLMGHAGLLSFGHAVFLGLGGYAAAHAVNAARAGGVWLPLEVVPLIGGLSGLGFAIVFGYVATKQRATAFAMITLGIGELVTSAAIMFKTFFGGEGGVSTNRMTGASLLGLRYSDSIQVYYLAILWTVLAIAGMRLLTMTPVGRMANACRDNFERAQFVGYDPAMVRFFQFSLAGFFAGLAGGLYAITYEIVTYDAVAGGMSANALLMTYIGGIGVFAGPVVGAVLIVLLQSWVSLLSNSWLVYVGLIFIVMVTYAPGGIAGLVLLHQPLWRSGRLGRLAGPYARAAVPALLAVVGFVLLVELCSFLTIGAAQGKSFTLGRVTIDPHAGTPWAVGAALLVGGGLWLWREGRHLASAWQSAVDAAGGAGERR